MSELDIAFYARPLQPQTRHWGPGEFIGNTVSRLSGGCKFVGLSHSLPGASEMSVETWPRIPNLPDFAVTDFVFTQGL